MGETMTSPPFAATDLAGPALLWLGGTLAFLTIVGLVALILGLCKAAGEADEWDEDHEDLLYDGCTNGTGVPFGQPDEFRGYYVDSENFIPFDPEARRARTGIGGPRDARA
jgi:hypothetical protein